MCGKRNGDGQQMFSGRFLAAKIIRKIFARRGCVDISMYMAFSKCSICYHESGLNPLVYVSSMGISCI